MGIKREIVENLMEADAYFAQMFPSEQSIEVTIIGGSAMVLMGCRGKITYDIDIINHFSDEILSYLESFSINNQAAHVAFLPKGFETRLKKTTYGTGNITYLIPSLEDLVLTKVNRLDTNDIEDLEHTDILEKVDFNLLYELGEEMASRSIAFRANWGRFQTEFSLEQLRAS